MDALAHGGAVVHRAGKLLEAGHDRHVFAQRLTALGDGDVADGGDGERVNAVDLCLPVEREQVADQAAGVVVVELAGRVGRLDAGIGQLHVVLLEHGGRDGGGGGIVHADQDIELGLDPDGDLFEVLAFDHVETVAQGVRRVGPEVGKGADPRELAVHHPQRRAGHDAEDDAVLADQFASLADARDAFRVRLHDLVLEDRGEGRQIFRAFHHVLGVVARDGAAVLAADTDDLVQVAFRRVPRVRDDIVLALTVEYHVPARDLRRQTEHVEDREAEIAGENGRGGIVPLDLSERLRQLRVHAFRAGLVVGVAVAGNGYPVRHFVPHHLQHVFATCCHGVEPFSRTKQHSYARTAITPRRKDRKRRGGHFQAKTKAKIGYRSNVDACRHDPCRLVRQVREFGSQKGARRRTAASWRERMPAGPFRTIAAARLWGVLHAVSCQTPAPAGQARRGPGRQHLNVIKDWGKDKGMAPRTSGFAPTRHQRERWFFVDACRVRRLVSLSWSRTHQQAPRRARSAPRSRLRAPWHGSMRAWFVGISGIASAKEYVVIDYSGDGTLVGEFAEVLGLKSGYELVYDGTDDNPDCVVLLVGPKGSLLLLR